MELGPRLGNEYEDCIRWASEYVVKNYKTPYAVEFGVATGKTLGIIREHMPVTGFDSFDGLPEDWRPGFPKGMFAGGIPKVAGTELVIGWFEDTLEEWVEWNSPKWKSTKLIHIDCDIYSATKTILDKVDPSVNRVIVFDEYHGYPGYEEHEKKAWEEWVEKHDVPYTVLGHGPEQLVVEI